MTATITPGTRRWTDARIEYDLRAAISELGQFPNRAQLVALGQRSLWEAMRRSGGIEHWRDRVALHHLPTPDQIAERAYQLYEAGVDGDSVTHWLAAERELAA